MNILQYPAMDCSPTDVDALFFNQFTHFESVWNGLQHHLDCPVIQNNFEEPWQRPMGNIDGTDYRGSSRFVARLNEAFANATTQHHNLYIHDIHYLAARIGLDHWFNPRQWYLYKYAMDMESIVALSWQLTGLITALFGLSKKCLAVDLDNTLWGGIIGDDGIDGICIGNATAEAEAHTDLQRYIKTLKQRGIVMAVCSKNDDANARMGFAHPESILHTDDFSSFKANWEPKTDNLRDISKQLNLSCNHMVFLDDNPAERDLIRQQLPEIFVPEIGNDVTHFLKILDQSAQFESISLSKDDLQRAQYYQENNTRQTEVQSFTSYNDFLKSLDMHTTIIPFCEKHIERITQLINKTNQFNLTTQRGSVSDILKMTHSNNHISLTASLQDKFGDSGLVSVVAGEIQNRILHITLWLMSCRVLKRGLEFALLESLCKTALDKNINTLIGYYKPTAKNTMVATFYQEAGFQLVSDRNGNTVWEKQLTASDTIPQHFISINNGGNNES
jgi:FkbH-like protein